MKIMKAALLAIFTVVLFIAFAPTSLVPVAEAADRYVLKYACYAPEGSTYVKWMRAWDAELRKKSDGRLSFRIYPGGVQGDERDMLRKVRIGQLHMVGMTGIGLGEVLPSIRILEMPLYYQNYGEVDRATEAASAQLESLLQESGYELLGWGEAGTVHVFSQKPIQSMGDLKKTRIWAWEGDEVSTSLFKQFEMAPVPLAIPDVLPSLQTGTIDAVYGSPLAVVALQWMSHIKYISEQSLGRAMGGTVIAKKQFDKLPPDLQTLLKETGKTFHHKIQIDTRKDNEKALETLKANGVQSIAFDDAEWAKLLEGSTLVRNNLTGDMWSQPLFDTVDAAVQAHRKDGASDGEPTQE